MGVGGETRDETRRDETRQGVGATPVGLHVKISLERGVGDMVATVAAAAANSREI